MPTSTFIDSVACRALWTAVWQRIIRDLCYGGHHYSERGRNRQSAENWVGTFPTHEFYTVCDLSGVEPTGVHARLQELIRLPVDERQKHIQHRLLMYHDDETLARDDDMCEWLGMSDQDDPEKVIVNG
ncbi:MAG: hypothetical protein OXC62_06375 [Aestuariivita sp.]|nr:hypothetical protein [Aestuariivita sp.]